MHIKDAHLWHIRTKHESKTSEIGQTGKTADKLWTKDFFSIALINLFVLSSGNMLIPTFPFYIKSFGGTELIVGIAASLYSIASLIMRPVAGWLLDHKGRKGIFYVGVLGLILVPVCYNFLTTIPMLIALRVLHGFMNASANTSSSTNACDIVPTSRFAEGMGMFGLTNSLAMAVAPALGQWVMNEFGFEIMFYCCAGFGVLSLFCLSRITLRPFQKPLAAKHSGSIPFKERISAVFHKDALPASLVLFLAMIPGGAISSFIALFSAEIGVGNGSVYFLVQAIGTGTARLFSGKLADRRGEGPMIYISTVLFLIGLGMVVFCQSAGVLYISGLLYGLAYGLCLPALQTMAVRIVPRAQRGAASSTYLCFFDIGWALGGLLGGVFVSACGYRGMYAIMSLGLFASVCLYYFWARNTKSAFRNLP